MGEGEWRGRLNWCCYILTADIFVGTGAAEITRGSLWAAKLCTILGCLHSFSLPPVLYYRRLLCDKIYIQPGDQNRLPHLRLLARAAPTIYKRPDPATSTHREHYLTVLVFCSERHHPICYLYKKKSKRFSTANCADTSLAHLTSFYLI